MTSSDRSGTTIGRYHLVRLIGRGGMGEVYEAVDTDKDRTVALKLLPAGLSGDDGFRARFMRESQTVAKLNDPHIIPIHDYGELDGHLFLDMRIVQGQDLRSVIKTGPMHPDRTVAVIEQVAAALDTAHAAGLLHRDVKPENVLLDSRDFAYLADFGLAQSAGQTRLTATGSAIGSFAYMAPERFGTDLPVGPPSDVYGLACVMYECLTGAQPFASTSIEQIIAGHLSRPVPPTGTPFDGVLAAGMAKDPSARFQTAGEFAAAARDVASGRTPQLPAGMVAAAHPATMLAPVGQPQPWTTAPGHPTYPPAAYQPMPQAAPTASRTALIAGAVAAVILLAAGGLTWILMSGDDGSDPTTAAASDTVANAPAPGTETSAVTPAAPTTTTVVPNQPPPSELPQEQPRAQRGAGDLGLSTPISTPSCDGTTVTFVYNAVSPGGYAGEISSALAQFPGASYLRTDQSCRSLKQSQNGNPIYAVYYPASSVADACTTKARLGGGAYTRRLDNSTPVGTEIC